MNHRWSRDEWRTLTHSRSVAEAIQRLPGRSAQAVRSQWRVAHRPGRVGRSWEEGRWDDTPAHRMLMARIMGQVRHVCRDAAVPVDGALVQRLLDVLRATSPEDWEEE